MKNYSSSQYIELLGEQLERNRLLQNIPQIDLAQKAGISVRTLRRFESGHGGSLDSFIRLLMALNLDGNLSVLLPDPTVRPMERTRPSKTERLRASRSRTLPNKPEAGKKSDWVWGDEKS